MKKLFAALLTCALLLAAVPALGETDPIVGVWYTYIVYDTHMIGAFYVFDANGGVAMIGLTVDKEGFNDSSLFGFSCGTWTKGSHKGNYTVDSGITSIDGPAYLLGDYLFLYSGNNESRLFRRLTNYNGQQVYTTQEVLQVILNQSL